MSHLTERERAAVSILLHEGYNKSTIASQLGVSRHTVYRWIDENQSLHDRPRSGRPRKLSQEQVNWLIHETQDKRRRSTRVMKGKFFTKFKVKVGHSLVARELL